MKKIFSIILTITILIIPITIQAQELNTVQEESVIGAIDGLTEYTSPATTEAEVLRRIEEVHNVLPGESATNHTYFNTLNNSPCAHSSGPQSCEYCEYKSVMKNRLGITPLAIGDDSWTCLGFVKFMHEYIFRRCFSNNMEEVWHGGYDKAEINKNAVAGDFVYFNWSDKNGSHFHTGIYVKPDGDDFMIYEAGYISWGASAIHYGDFDFAYIPSSVTVEIKRDTAYNELVKNGSNTDATTTPTFKNPRKNSNGDTIWDCVYFGNYWQNDTNGDYKADIKDKKQPIKWRVLSVDGNNIFLLSDKNLDRYQYSWGGSSIKWEDSYIRNWLNGLSDDGYKLPELCSCSSFVDTAFTLSEKNAIYDTIVKNDSTTVPFDREGNDTLDKVFLLSYSEILDPQYGFTSEYDAPDKAKRADDTEFVVSSENYHATSYAENAWWLRSVAGRLADPMYISPEGYLNKNGYYGNGFNLSIRPALHLDLSQNVCSYAGTVCSDGTVDEKEKTGSLDGFISDDPTSTPDTNTVLNPYKNGRNKYAVSGSGKVTLLVGDKLQIEGAKKHSFKVRNGKYITVSSKGDIKAKKAGSGAIITYTTTSGETAAIEVTSVYPKLESCEDVGISKLNVIIKKGTEFDIPTNIPLEVAFSCTSKNEFLTISGFKAKVDADGFLHLKGKTLSKGTVKYQFILYGKKYSLKFKIQPLRGDGGGFR